LPVGGDGAWPCMRAGKDAIGRDVVALGVGGEGFDLVAGVAPHERPNRNVRANALMPRGATRRALTSRAIGTKGGSGDRSLRRRRAACRN
jgi:hypothetical protein